jgi:hypothetical protein
VYDHTLVHLAEVKNNSSFRRFEVSALVGSSYAVRMLRRPAEARQRLDAAFDRLRQLKLYPTEKVKLGSEAEDALRADADYEAGTGNLPGAITIHQKLREQVQATKPNPEVNLFEAVRLSNLLGAEAAVQRQAGRADLASSLETRRLDLWRLWERQLPNNPFVRRQLEAAHLP